ncbi:MAG: RdgB/HAM1 family non-canonical purine NTP pyrophosphatase [Acidobacteriota bacterium]
MSKPPLPITIATFNTGKLREYRSMLSGLNVDLQDLSDFNNVQEIAETAATFAGNAALKASGYAELTRTLTLADDSGLEVAAMGGRPGVLSARYGGAATSFDDKMRLILAEIAENRSADRSARFVCEIAVADERGIILYKSRGVCSGTIALEPRGKGGFGYDPIFLPDGLDQSFGELSPSVKQRISHRAAAFDQIIPYLRDYTAI